MFGLDKAFGLQLVKDILVQILKNNIVKTVKESPRSRKDFGEMSR